jgi:hypothetical protein
MARAIATRTEVIELVTCRLYRSVTVKIRDRSGPSVLYELVAHLRRLHLSDQLWC